MTDEKHITTVQRLMAKAESTDSPEEAEAFMAKAQELITKHAIDTALLAEARGDAASDEIITETLKMAAPYASAKALLVGAIAKANTCRAIETNGHVLVVGHRSDVESVTAMFASLVVHATRTVMTATIPPRDTPRRFRHAFFLAYAVRIGERLQEAKRSAIATADAESASGTGSALVLVRREDAVDADVARQFPNLRHRRVSSSSGAGHVAGRNAANSAGIGGGSVGSGSRRALGA